jgi:hypothetical protein
MSLQILSRVAAVSILAIGIGRLVAAELKGEYKIEISASGEAYSGTTKVTPGAKGEFSGDFTLTSPTNVTGDIKGKTFGDSVTYESKYNDKDRGCTGTLTAKGTAEKDGGKASGAVSINDSCGGDLTGTFRIWR